MEKPTLYSSKSNAKRAAEKAVKAKGEGWNYDLYLDPSGQYGFTMIDPSGVDHGDAEPAAPEAPAQIVEPAVPGDQVQSGAAAVVEIPFSYLPGTREAIVEVLRNDLATETRSVLYRVLDDAGIPLSEIRGMAREVAEEHVLRAIEEDRAAFAKDYGKHLSPEQAAALKETNQPAKAKRTRAAAGTATTAVANRRKDSEIESPVKRVWAIADKHVADTKGDYTTIKRKDVLALCDAEGIAFYTARTQYQRWFAAQKESAANQAKAKAEHANR